MIKNDIYNDCVDRFVKSLKNHSLVCELDTELYKAYYMHNPLQGRIMSCRIIFSPEGICISGDFSPTPNGACSNIGYGLQWFSGDLSDDYLAEKFLIKQFVREYAITELENISKDIIDNNNRNKLIHIIQNLENNTYDQNGLYMALVDGLEWILEDRVPGYNYDIYQQASLVAIQKTFSSLVKEE